MSKPIAVKKTHSYKDDYLKKETPTMVKENSKSIRPVSAPVIKNAPTYREAYQRAKESGKLDRPTYRIHTWSEDSALLIGKVTRIDEFEGGKFEAAVNAYRIETDDGVVSCILGSYTDAQLDNIPLEGKTIAIVYGGQKELEDGRKVNIFDIDILPGGGD